MQADVVGEKIRYGKTGDRHRTADDTSLMKARVVIAGRQRAQQRAAREQWGQFVGRQHNSRRAGAVSVPPGGTDKAVMIVQSVTH